jgi:hypothetical protein
MPSILLWMPRNVYIYAGNTRNLLRGRSLCIRRTLSSLLFHARFLMLTDLSYRCDVNGVTKQLRSVSWR